MRLDRNTHISPRESSAENRRIESARISAKKNTEIAAGEPAEAGLNQPSQPYATEMAKIEDASGQESRVAGEWKSKAKKVSNARSKLASTCKKISDAKYNLAATSKKVNDAKSTQVQLTEEQRFELLTALQQYESLH